VKGKGFRPGQPVRPSSNQAHGPAGVSSNHYPTSSFLPLMGGAHLPVRQPEPTCRLILLRRFPPPTLETAPRSHPYSLSSQSPMAPRRCPLTPQLLLFLSPPTPEPARPPSYRNPSSESMQLATIRTWFHRGQGTETPVFGTPLLHLRSRISLIPSLIYLQGKSPSSSSSGSRRCRIDSGHFLLSLHEAIEDADHTIAFTQRRITPSCNPSSPEITGEPPSSRTELQPLRSTFFRWPLGQHRWAPPSLWSWYLDLDPTAYFWQSVWTGTRWSEPLDLS
jgi:hypothetical protein